MRIPLPVFSHREGVCPDEDDLASFNELSNPVKVYSLAALSAITKTKKAMSQQFSQRLTFKNGIKGQGLGREEQST